MYYVMLLIVTGISEQQQSRNMIDGITKNKPTVLQRFNLHQYAALIGKIEKSTDWFLSPAT